MGRKPVLVRVLGVVDFRGDVDNDSLRLADALEPVVHEGRNLEEAEGLLHAMAREFGGDPAATDATRVLRLPGFANRASVGLRYPDYLNFAITFICKEIHIPCH